MPLILPLLYFQPVKTAEWPDLLLRQNWTKSPGRASARLVMACPSWWSTSAACTPVSLLVATYQVARNFFT